MVILGALCAYPLAKHPFPGRKIVFGVILLSIMISVETMGIPRYIVVKSLGIMNTYWGHVLPILALPVGVFLLKQFMDQVPDELLEAAKLDGATEWQLLVRIILPIVTPHDGDDNDFVVPNRLEQFGDIRAVYAGRRDEDAAVLRGIAYIEPGEYGGAARGCGRSVFNHFYAESDHLPAVAAESHSDDGPFGHQVG